MSLPGEGRSVGKIFCCCSQVGQSTACWYGRQYCRVFCSQSCLPTLSKVLKDCLPFPMPLPVNLPTKFL